MASISRQSNGFRTIQFVAGDGKRKSLRLGKVSQRVAEEVRVKVEALNAAAISGCPIDTETAAWLAKIGSDLHDRLAAVGLVTPRTSAHVCLGKFIADYIAKRTDAKPQTLSNLKMFGDRLMAFFGPDRNLADIKRSDADDWVLYLKREYAPATAGRTLKGARQFFKAAVRADLIRRNPFEDIKAGSQPDKERQCFITQEDTQRAITKCPDYEWRLLVALSRFGGLRCPSEHMALEWTDLDWERDRFRVTSRKTEHHEGKDERWVPIFPELRPFLEEAFELAEEGAVHVIAKHRNVTNLRTRFAKIIRRAGLTPWPKLFQNLRASRETELAAQYPLHVVCAWLGNSRLVAQKHYLQVTDADFQRAAKGGAYSGAVAVQNAVQQPAAPSRTESQESSEEDEDCELMRDGATCCKSMLNNSLRLEGVEPLSTTTLHTTTLRKSASDGAAKSGAVSAGTPEPDPDLAEVVAAWSRLNPEVRASILNLVRGSHC